MATDHKLDLESDVLCEFSRHLRDVTLHIDMISVMKERLSRFRETVVVQEEQSEFMDIELAFELIEKSEILLSVAESDPESERNLYILSAVRYLIESDDVNHDFDRIDGFDDDEHVINAVIKRFKLEDEVAARLKDERSA